jgi:CheY-like chemotaxis protein
MSRQSSPIVLIAEDEGLIALEMMEFLAREGYRVTDPVPTGEEAVERCEGDPRPDIVLMDLVLAGKINGIEAIRRIRERYPIPVILMTACSGDQTSAIVQDLSPDGCLIKPFTRDELLSTIARVLESRAEK